MHFGDRTLDENKVFQEFLFEKSNEQIKAKTIVFLRIDLLTDSGIGQRGDNSMNDCLEGILDALQNNPKMKPLAGCAAIVIENGVDSAFLIKLNDRGEISHCQVFFRTIRTHHAYRHESGTIRSHGASIIASCLKFLIDTELLGKDLFERLSDGIKDGLFRMLLQFHCGYLVLDQKSNNTSDTSSGVYFDEIFQAESPVDFNELKEKITLIIDNIKEKTGNNTVNELCAQLLGVLETLEEVQKKDITKEEVDKLTDQIDIIIEKIHETKLGTNIIEAKIENITENDRDDRLAARSLVFFAGNFFARLKFFTLIPFLHR